jgi:NAD+ synthase (glutamine-hydrolysing)
MDTLYCILCVYYTQSFNWDGIMKNLRVGLAQLNTTVGDFDSNIRLILDAATKAKESDADVVIFPELAITGYPPEDLLLRRPFIDQAMAKLKSLAEQAKNLPPIVVGCLDFEQHLYNSAAVLYEGKIQGIYHKQMLPNYGVFDEERYFQSGNSIEMFEIGGVLTGVTICEDMWYPEGPVRQLSLEGAQIILNLNASPFHAGKTDYRERMISTRATDNTVAIAYVNQVGGQDDLVFDGNSIVVDAKGNVIGRASSMCDDLLVVDIAVDEIAQQQLHESRLRRVVTSTSVKPPVLISSSKSDQKNVLTTSSIDRKEDVAEIYDALVLGTRDYVKKSGFNSVWVALSGGIDSALVAAIAVDALGPSFVQGLSMPSRYSSGGSITDAEELANNLKIALSSIPIEKIHEKALLSLENEFKDLPSNTAEENLQSRIRGMLVMALSNKQSGSLVLTTGNKSEYACGYATLYGDMVGGFAVIKDVPKTMVWDLAKYRNTLTYVIPQNSIDKPPSAELRPDQLDTDSLPEYDILDPIIEAYVEEDLSLEAIVSRGFDEKIARNVIDMINRNEYKRRQSPPGVKITPRAFGRDRRLPLATRYAGY